MKSLLFSGDDAASYNCGTEYNLHATLGWGFWAFPIWTPIDDGIHYPIQYCEETPMENRLIVRQKAPIAQVSSEEAAIAQVPSEEATIEVVNETSQMSDASTADLYLPEPTFHFNPKEVSLRTAIESN